MCRVFPVRGHPHSCRQQARRYPGLHSGGREQGKRYGGEFPHLAPSSDESHPAAENQGEGIWITII